MVPPLRAGRCEVSPPSRRPTWTWDLRRRRPRAVQGSQSRMTSGAAPERRNDREACLLPRAVQGSRNPRTPGAFRTPPGETQAAMLRPPPREARDATRPQSPTAPAAEDSSFLNLTPSPTDPDHLCRKRTMKPRRASTFAASAQQPANVRTWSVIGRHDSTQLGLCRRP